MNLKSITTFIISLLFVVSNGFSQSVRKPQRWGSWRGKPNWPPRLNEGAPVPDDEVPIDSYDILLFAVGLLLVYVLWQRNLGKSWKEVFSIRNAYSSLVLKI